MIKFANVIIESETATVQDAFEIWLRSILGELAGPNGEMPPRPEIEAYMWVCIREVRNELLRDSDWMVLDDSPIKNNVSTVKAYRQKLRDIPQDYTDPHSVQFPTLNVN